MNKKFLKKIAITSASLLGGLYIIFLAAPLVLNPIIKNYNDNLSNIIRETTGLDSEIYNIKVVTTPKLTAGLKVEKFTLLEPNKQEILAADDFQVKMSLIPLLARKIEVDTVQLKNIRANILINKDVSLALEKYFDANA